MSANSTVAIEGPVCADSKVLGWSFNHLDISGGETDGQKN